jgi:hypothetical protein
VPERGAPIKKTAGYLSLEGMFGVQHNSNIGRKNRFMALTNRFVIFLINTNTP